LQITGAWYTFTGERPPAGASTAAPGKPTPSGSVRATVAASVDEATENSSDETEATDAEPVEATETSASAERESE
jgi:hypothetical protein